MELSFFPFVVRIRMLLLFACQGQDDLVTLLLLKYRFALEVQGSVAYLSGAFNKVELHMVDGLFQVQVRQFPAGHP